MALRALLAAAQRGIRPPLKVRTICLIVDSRVIDSYDEQGDLESCHALALTSDDSNETRHKLIIRRNEPDAIAGFRLPKSLPTTGSMPELLGCKTYKPTRVDTELVNELTRLLKRGAAAAWEAEDVVRSNGGVLMPYHICEVLQYYQEDPDLAYAFFRWADMYTGYEHDQYSCNAVIKILGKSGRFKEIETILRGMEEQMIPITYVTYRILMRIYVDAGKVEEALETFHRLENCEIKPNVEDYNFFMFKLLKFRCPQVVPMVFDSMREKKIIPTTVSHNYLISSLCLLGRAEEAYWRLVRMKKYCKPDEFTYYSLINGFCKCMDADKAVELLEEMLSFRLRPDPPLFNMLLDCHARCGRYDAVVGLFEKMMVCKCQPDRKTYKLLVDAFAASGRIEETFGFLQKFMDGEYPPNLGAFNTLMNRLGRANKAHAALEVFHLIKDMPEYKPDLVTYNVVMDLLGKVGRIQDAWNCFLKVKALYPPDAFTYNTIIVRLGKAGMLEQCLKVMEDMSAYGIPPDHITYAGIIDACGKTGNLDLALKYLEEMKSRGFVPNSGTLDMLVNMLLKAGRYDAAEVLVTELGSRMNCPPKMSTRSAGMREEQPFSQRFIKS